MSRSSRTDLSTSWLAKAIMTSLSKEEVDDYMELSKEDAAVELAQVQ